jgi:hypothetical protein
MWVRKGRRVQASPCSNAGRYNYKLVPGVRTTTKAEALTAAQNYREQILASGQLPPKGERQARAKPPATPVTPTLVIPGVTRVEID